MYDKDDYDYDVDDDVDTNVLKVSKSEATTEMTHFSGPRSDRESGNTISGMIILYPVSGTQSVSMGFSLQWFDDLCGIAPTTR